MTYAQFQQPPYAPYQHKPYESANTRARIVTILLIVGAVISLLTIPSHVLDMYVHPLTEGQEVSDNPGGFLSLALTAVLGLAMIAVYIATVVVFLMWLYRVSNNVAAFGATTQHSSGWAVGSFFVPIMNLFVPYQAVKDIWQKSEPSGDDSFSYSVSAPGFFAAWWGFWIASNIAGQAYFRMAMAEAPAEALGIVGILSEILSIAAALFAIQVVKDIDRRQDERARNLTQSAPPPPPVFEREPLPAPNAAPSAQPVETVSLEEPSETTDLSGSSNPSSFQD